MSIRSIRPRQSPLFSSYRPRRPSPLIIAWTVSADTRLICKRKTNARNASATDRPNWTGPDWTNLFRDEKKKKKNEIHSTTFLSSFLFLFLFFFCPLRARTDFFVQLSRVSRKQGVEINLYYSCIVVRSKRINYFDIANFESGSG